MKICIGNNIEYCFMDPAEGSNSEVYKVCYCNGGLCYLIMKDGKFGLGNSDILSILVTDVIMTSVAFHDVLQYRSSLRYNYWGTPIRRYNY